MPLSNSFAQILETTVRPGAGDIFPDRPFTIYVPRSVPVIRGVYIDFPGHLGDSRNRVDDREYLQLFSETDFAFLGLRSHWPEYDGFYWRFGQHIKSIYRALADFALQTGRPELESAPLFLDGFSEGSVMALLTTWWKPEAIIAFIAQKSDTRLLLEAAAGVPGYLMWGEFDTRDMTAIFEKHRAQGALWSVAKEIGAWHGRISDRDLLDNYFRSVIELRLPDETTPGEPVVLNALNESDGWLGNNTTLEVAQYDSFSGDKSQASWFPSESVALKWQSFFSSGTAESALQTGTTENPNLELHQSTDTRRTHGRAVSAEAAESFSLTDADASFVGEAASDNAGFSVSAAGDVNGDGIDDFLISAPRNAGRRGKIYLFLGKAVADWGLGRNLVQADASFIGETALDEAGFAVASAGDVNGDGYDDFLIGAPFRNEGGDRAGHTYLILGRAQADWGPDFSLAQSDASFLGNESQGWAGSSVASAGDVNGDGLDDFLIGANGVDVDITNIEPQTLNFEFGAGETFLVLGRSAADWGMDFRLADADASFLGETWGRPFGLCSLDGWRCERRWL